MVFSAGETQAEAAIPVVPEFDFHLPAHSWIDAGAGRFDSQSGGGIQDLILKRVFQGFDIAPTQKIRSAADSKAQTAVAFPAQGRESR